MRHERQQPIPRTPDESRAATIERLAAPAMIDRLSWLGLRSVMALRILAVSSRAGREPLSELACRLGSVPAAASFVAFADLVGRSWPENVLVMRPCSRVLSHDEMTLASLVEHALAGDRAGFVRVLDGLVRPSRHEPLYAAATETAAHLSGSSWARA